jgi:hypothetical protein
VVLDAGTIFGRKTPSGIIMLLFSIADADVKASPPVITFHANQ